MTEKIRPVTPILVVSLSLILSFAATAGFAQAAMTTSVDGTVASVNSTTLSLTTPDGTTKSVVLSPDTLVLERRAATLDDIKKGDKLGVTTHRAEDGAMTATMINIFSAELYAKKEVRKGQFDMQQPGQIMTNAVVGAYAVNGDGRSLTMRYGDETFPIVVPGDTEVHRLVTVKLSMVKEGMHVLVRGSAAGNGGIRAIVVSFDQQS